MKAMDLPQRHGEHREDFGLERVHPRGDGKYAQSTEATRNRGATWCRWFWRLDTGGWTLETRKRRVPHPRCFCKGNNILDSHDGLWDDSGMRTTLQLPKTLQEAVSFFSDPQKTFDYAVSLRWPTGKVTCPRCDSTEHSFISTRRLWFCKGCKKQFTVKVGTIFEDSALGMDKWMIAVWLIVNCKNGISSYEVARALGITQKSAWFMMHRIRLAMQDQSFVRLGVPASKSRPTKRSSAAK